MTMNEILDVIAMFASSQGFYGRLLNSIMELKNNDIDAYNSLSKELEGQNFSSDLDVILFFEC